MNHKLGTKGQKKKLMAVREMKIDKEEIINTE
jgi:hypothetical protein